MKFQLIRNATLKLNYGGKTILVDPMLCPKETFPPFVKGLLRNPTVDLNLTKEEVLEDVEGVLVTHSHPDHFDELSAALLPEEVKLICTPVDQDWERFKKFTNKEVVEDKIVWEGISITRINGQHGSGPVLQYMGQVSGYILEAANEPVVYIVSDSIWIDEIATAIKKYQPGIIITNSGGGIFPGLEKFPVMLDEEQTIKVLNESQDAKLIAVHLESIDFCRVTRKSLREFAKNKGIAEDRLIIPMDGEKMNF